MNQTQPGTRRALRVLIIEDSENDALLLITALERGGFECSSQRVQARPELEQALKHREWDLILADHSLPSFSAPEALKLVKAEGLDIPFIIVSGNIDESTAVSAMMAGAHDYVMKDRLARLVAAVERELREALLRRMQRKYEEDLRQARDELELRVEERTADLMRAKEQLERVLEERRRLEIELLDIAENERRSIGFDLHDDLGQKLTGANMMARALEQRLKKEDHCCAQAAGEIQALIDQMLLHTHNLARQFSSLDAQGRDLREVLGGLADNAGRMFGLPVEFSIKGVLPVLPCHATVQLQKIAQEAVSNAIKHGKATRVCVSLRCEGKALELEVRNDGLPFSVPDTRKNRLGLRIMNYRANTIGASLEIKPLERGALVVCRMPLQGGTAMGRMKTPAPAAPAVSN